MKKLVGKFGKYTVATFIIMGVGLIAFLLTPLLIWLFEIDSDIFGFFIFLIGLAMYMLRLIIKKVLRKKE